MARLSLWVLALQLVWTGSAAPQFIVPRPVSRYPDTTNTGVPAGTSLTAYSGANPVTVNNTIIDSKTISATLEIRASGVVIKNSRIQVSDTFAILLDDSNAGFSNWSVTVQDSEIDCGGDPPGGVNNSTALGSAFITGRRLNIHGCENGGDVNQSFDVQDSYIHDLRQCSAAECGGDGSHTDGFQMSSCHFTPAGSATCVSGVLNVTIKHNTIYSMKTGAGTPEATEAFYTTSAIISNPSGDTNVLIQNNILAGGAFTLYCEQSSTGTNYQVLDNRFSTRFKSTIGFFGPSSGCADETKSGNVYHETGLPITLD